LETKTPKRFALALLAATCLTPVAAAQAAPGDRIGPEFQVNTTTIGDQTVPAVAMDSDGDFVVAWQSNGQDGDGAGIFAQQYNAASEPLGGEFQVNTVTTNDQTQAQVAMDADGDFVVAWTDCYSLYNCEIFARRYDAAGAPQGGEFQVSTAATGYRRGGPIAMDADGNFVVAWHSCTGDPLIEVVCTSFAQRFDSSGARQGPELAFADSLITNVSMDADGDFVMVRSGDDGNGDGVIAQLFSATGQALSGEILVNTTTSGNQVRGAVAMAPSGEFVVSWTGSQTFSWDIFAQRFDASGSAVGAESQVNTFSPGEQHYSVVATNADGGFVVLWSGRGRDDSRGIFGRRYDASGSALEDELRVNVTVSGVQEWPSAAMDADGDLVVTWHSSGQDGDANGIFAQRFDGAERVEGDFDGDGKADLLWRNPATGQTIVWLMDGDAKLAEGSIGTVPSKWEIAGTGDFNGDGKADVLWRNSTTGTAIVWQMDGLERAAAQSIGAVPLAWTVEQLRDTNGDGLSDIVWRNAGSGVTVVWRMSGFTKTAADPIGSVPSDWDLH
ncbi:MAG: VCBS repeat-containing protein, partial [Rhodospirillales bacterium]|nr:VCBS repeat-containing protein [Rhodospirillales bacterium]